MNAGRNSDCAAGMKTLLVMHDRYPSKEALDAVVSGMEDGMRETFEQLDELLVTLPTD